MCTSSIQMLRSTRVGDRGRREGRGGGVGQQCSWANVNANMPQQMDEGCNAELCHVASTVLMHQTFLR